ncbi:uncharacterized protein G2W53_027448 [Senna tora]|uniref:Uncharacterized protein n=1 Tax=Senna tora TaxID=362788 RepID=A0A834TH49_9FABA|nr:uncharacterized protein G2W53_027448 [Senna tora]
MTTTAITNGDRERQKRSQGSGRETRTLSEKISNSLRKTPSKASKEAEKIRLFET